MFTTTSQYISTYMLISDRGGPPAHLVAFTVGTLRQGGTELPPCQNDRQNDESNSACLPRIKKRKPCLRRRHREWEVVDTTTLALEEALQVIPPSQQGRCRRKTSQALARHGRLDKKQIV